MKLLEKILKNDNVDILLKKHPFKYRTLEVQLDLCL